MSFDFFSEHSYTGAIVSNPCKGCLTLCLLRSLKRSLDPARELALSVFSL